MEKDKKYNVVLGLMIFFFILFVGVCVAWGLGFIGLKTNADSTNTNNENVVNNDTNKEIDNITSTNKSENTNTTNVVIKNTYVPFDVSKIDLGEDTFIYPSTDWNLLAQTGFSNDNAILTMEITKDGGVVATTLKAFDDFKENVQYKVEGLNKKALGIYISQNGQEICENCILIMEDGTIENIGVDGNRLYSTGTIEGYSNVVRLETHNITGYNRETGEGGGGATATFVIQGDGTIKHLPFIK